MKSWNYILYILYSILYNLYPIIDHILMVQCSWRCRGGKNFCSPELFFFNVQCSAKTQISVCSLLIATSSCPWIVLMNFLYWPVSAAIIDYSLYPLPCHWTSITIGFISNYCFGEKKFYTTYYGMTWGYYGTERSHKDNLATIYQSAEKISFVSGHVTNVAVKCFKSSYITGI